MALTQQHVHDLAGTMVATMEDETTVEELNELVLRRYQASKDRKAREASNEIERAFWDGKSWQ